VKAAALRAGIQNLAPHDLRRTCARLCHVAGGELEQIQFLLGPASVQTTERYLGCKQELRHPVNDRLALWTFGNRPIIWHDGQIGGIHGGDCCVPRQRLRRCSTHQ
jgi:integrase